MENGLTLKKTMSEMTTQEIADLSGVEIGVVRNKAFELFPRNEMVFHKDRKCLVFTAEQSERLLESLESKPQKTLLLGNGKPLCVKEWYTIDELAEISGLSVETLKGGHSPLNDKDFGIGLKTESKIQNVGGHKNIKVYSENVLNALQMYLVQNGTNNSMKNKAQVQENIVRTVSELTYEATLDEIKQSFDGKMSMLSDATKEMIARDIKIGMQTEYIKEAKPKADYFDAVCDSENLTEIGTVGKNVGIGSQKFFKVLTEDKIIRKRFVDGVDFYEPYYGYERYFQSVPVPFEKDGKKLSRNKLLFNQGGVVWATRKYRKI